jgi:hypothetical protein
MHKYIKREPYITSFLPSQGAIVIDVNCQGVFTLTDHQERFKTHFPESYALYLKLLMDDGVCPGDVIWVKESEHTIAMMVTRSAIVGSKKDKDNDVRKYIETAVQTILKSDVDTPLLCPIMNMPHHHIFREAITKYGKTLDWYIYGS